MVSYLQYNDYGKVSVTICPQKGYLCKDCKKGDPSISHQSTSCKRKTAINGDSKSALITMI